MDVDIRYLPTQEPAEVLRQLHTLGADATLLYQVPAAQLNPYNDHVKLLRHVVRDHRDGRALGVGRHGASDAVLFLERGIPCVEFGPAGAGPPRARRARRDRVARHVPAHPGRVRAARSRAPASG